MYGVNFLHPLPGKGNYHKTDSNEIKAIYMII